MKQVARIAALVGMILTLFMLFGLASCGSAEESCSHEWKLDHCNQYIEEIPAGSGTFYWCAYWYNKCSKCGEIQFAYKETTLLPGGGWPVGRLPNF
jgi:hypothetical protein